MGEVMKRDVTFSGGSTVAPHELHYYLAGMAIGDVTNNGTSNTDYVTQIAARTALSQGYGPFRNGASQATSYANAAAWLGMARMARIVAPSVLHHVTQRAI